MPAPHVIVVADRDPNRAQEWRLPADGRHALTVLVEHDLGAARARLSTPPPVTLVVRCRHFCLDEVVELVSDARSASAPVEAVLLTDEGERYRTALAARGLVAEVLSSAATAADLLGRLGLPADATLAKGWAR